jgi:hypothetical protein
MFKNQVIQPTVHVQVRKTLESFSADSVKDIKNGDKVLVTVPKIRTGA